MGVGVDVSCVPVEPNDAASSECDVRSIDVASSIITTPL